MDDRETLHRRARLRELIAICFEGKDANLLDHIQRKTGKRPNQGEMSGLQKDHGSRSFGDKKAKTLTEQVGLHRRWFDFGLGCNLAQSEWTSEESMPRPSHGAGRVTTVLPWPFPSVSEKDVRNLEKSQLSALEGAIALAIAQLKLGVQISPSAKPAPTSRGGLANLDSAADEFPMAPVVDQAPWAGGKTTKQMEREGLVQFGLDRSVATNVTAGEPVAANEKFEKVSELADVRLAAGDGIEAENELVTGAIQFRQSFLRSVGADKGRGRVVYAKGDSMEGDIKDGWALLVVPDDSLTIRDLVPKTVYAINYDGKMIVKIIDKDPLTGKWVAKSANRRYRDIPLEAEGVSVRILGRVVWAGGRLDQGGIEA